MAGCTAWGLRSSGLRSVGAPKGLALVPGYTGLWLFDDGAGSQTIRDYSGNGYHGTNGSTAGADTNDVTLGTTGATFGGDDLVTCGTGPDGSVAGVTVMAVANPTADANQTLVSKQTETAGTGKAGFGLVKASTANQYRMYAAGADGVMKSASFLSHTTGTWGIVTAVADGAAIYGYTGTTPSTATATECAGFTPAAAQKLTVGRLSYSAAFFLTGSIAAALVYPFTLTPAQVAQNYAYLKALMATRGVTLA